MEYINQIKEVISTQDVSQID